MSAARRTRRVGESGQAGMVLLGLLLAVVLGAVVLGGVARGVGVRGELQSAADLSALAAARAMHDAYPRVFEPPVLGGVENPRHLERAEYLALGEHAAHSTAARNGAHDVDVAFPSGGLAPIRVRVTVRDAIGVGGRAEVPNAATAEAELAPPGTDGDAGALTTGEYRGPFAQRQGKPMRPDVALAFDRMAAAARADGVALLIASAFRTDAEQAALFAAHPDPKWVAPPGRSLHRLGTELDLGPPAAYRWLAANAGRFHFLHRTTPRGKRPPSAQSTVARARRVARSARSGHPAGTGFGYSMSKAIGSSLRRTPAARPEQARAGPALGALPSGRSRRRDATPSPRPLLACRSDQRPASGEEQVLRGGNRSPRRPCSEREAGRATRPF